MRIAIGAFAFLTLLTTAGCGLPSASHESTSPEATAPTWPAAPMPARIRFERAFRGPGEFGIDRSPSRRIVDRLFGRADDRFVRPTNVAEKDGVVYVADPGTPALWILDSSRGRYTKVESAGNTPLLSPVAIALRPDGAVYVADSQSARVLLFDREGKFVKVAAQNELERPAGVAYDPNDERLYVVDSARHRCFTFAPDGRMLLSIGEPGLADGKLNRPSHVAMSPGGTLLVTDALNFRIQAFNSRGEFVWKFGHNGDGSGDFAAPKGVATDSVGHVYVVDALFDAVQIFRSDGTYLLSFGERGAGPGQFSLPGGVFINGKDQIFVADAYNGRVQVFQAIAVDDNGQSEK